MLCAALSAPGQSFGLAFYLDPLMAATELSRLEISGLYSGATLAAAAFLPLLGWWADGAEGGRFLGLVILGMAGSMALLASTGGVVTLVVALLLLRMLGQGAVGLGTLALVVRWFERRGCGCSSSSSRSRGGAGRRPPGTTGRVMGTGPCA